MELELRNVKKKFNILAHDVPRYHSNTVLIGETGVPFDMKESGLLGLAKGSEGKGDYRESSKVS